MAMGIDLGYNNPKAGKWVSPVGLITSIGPHGQDIMAAEWTYYVSYSPALISVHIGKGKTTLENIKATKEFGVSMAASDQNMISSIAGKGHGDQLDKMAVLRDMGTEFIDSKHIKPQLVKGAAMHFECRLHQIIELGDHTMVVGEVLEASTDETKEPIAYSFGKYRKLGPIIEKPPQEVLDRIEQLRQKHARKV